MSTPPPPFPDDPLELSPPKRMRLAPIAAVLAIVILIAFGVCAASLNLNGPVPIIAKVAIGVEIACIVGLIVLAVIGLNRS